jgi:hypothetical protein
MADPIKVFAIVHSRDGQDPETIETGLSEEAAREWLLEKASQLRAATLGEMSASSREGDVWSAVEA